MDATTTRTTGDRVIAGIAAATVIGLAAVAAVISYRHAYAVAIAHGEIGATAILMPITVDGLVLVAGLVMLDSARRRRRSPWLAWAALVLGIGATVAVNVLHGWAHGPVGAAVAAWPAITLVVAIELMMMMIRRSATATGTATETATAEETAAPEEAPEGDREPAPVLTLVETGTETGTETATAATATGTARAGGRRRVDIAVKVAEARDRYADLLAAQRLPSVNEIRRDLGVGFPRAKRILAELAS